ncbi:MAG: HEAT repeat domain-containing protein [Armatimonadetes bacterium]|nr:HEAT repeat domain-containing protein [Armatimonadota bacterium]
MRTPCVFLLVGLVGCAESVEGLARRLSDGDANTRREAIIALGERGQGAAGAVSAIAQVLDDPQPDIRVAAAAVLGHMGPGAKEAVPELVAATKDEDPKVRFSAISAITQIGLENPGFIPDLALRAVDEIPTVRHCAAVLLGRFGAKAKAAVPALMEAFSMRPLGIYEEASAAGASKDERARALMFDFQTMLACRAAAEALGQIGPEASSAVPMLTEALHDPSAGIREAAEKALKRIQGKE